MPATHNSLLVPFIRVYLSLSDLAPSVLVFLLFSVHPIFLRSKSSLSVCVMNHFLCLSHIASIRANTERDRERARSIVSNHFQHFLISFLWKHTIQRPQVILYPFLPRSRFLIHTAAHSVSEVLSSVSNDSCFVFLSLVLFSLRMPLHLSLSFYLFPCGIWRLL